MLAVMTMLGAALAGAPVAAFPDGPPRPGGAATLHVHADSLPAVTAEQGLVLSTPEPVGPSLWSLRYRAPIDSTQDTLLLQAGEAQGRRVVTLRPPPPSVMTITPPPPRMLGGPRPLRVRVQGDALPPPELLTVAVTEGTVSAVDAAEDGLVIRWVPGRSPFPRVLPVGVLDRSRPGTAPSWTFATLRSTFSLPVNTEAAAEVTVRVGGRTYGPVTAGEDGVATFNVELRPGETTVEVTAEDQVGNRQRSVVSVGSFAQPSLAVLVDGELGGELAAPTAYLFAVTADGSPWRGRPPSCTLDDAPVTEVLPIGEGQWALQADRAGRLDCVLDGLVQATALVRRGPAPPQELTLRLDPPVLSNDNPTAEVIAYVTDASGERRDPNRLVLAAKRGAVTTQVSGDIVRGRYDGSEVLEGETDVLVATWQRGGGAPVAWTARVEEVGLLNDGLTARIRVLDRRGLSAPGVAVQASLGGSALTAVTDAEGWAQLALASPSAPAVLQVFVGERFVEHIVVPEALAALSPQPRPDLRQEIRLRFQAGRVTGIFLTTSPRVIEARTGFTRVEVRPLDQEGDVVRDVDVRVEASEGRLTMIQPEPDGSYYATYFPPEDMVSGTVRLKATTSDGVYEASTDLEVVPFIYDRSIELSGGVLWGQPAVEWPGLWFNVRPGFQPEALRERPWSRNLWAVVELGGVWQEINDTDAQTGAAVRIEQFTSTLGAGGLYRLQRRRWSVWSGGTLVWPSLYWQRSAIDGEEITRGFGGAWSPGGQLFFGVGAQPRSFSGEFQLQVRLLGLRQDAPAVGWQGQVGGFGVTSGYTFLF